MALTISAARRVRPLSRALRRARAEGIPQYAVAAEAGISAPYLSLIASGQMQPALTTAERIAAALGESVGELFPELLDHPHHLNGAHHG